MAELRKILFEFREIKHKFSIKLFLFNIFNVFISALVFSVPYIISMILIENLGKIFDFDNEVVLELAELFVGTVSGGIATMVFNQKFNNTRLKFQKIKFKVDSTCPFCHSELQKLIVQNNSRIKEWLNYCENCKIFVKFKKRVEN